MKRTYELDIERTVVDTYVVEARSRTEASMKVSEAMLNGEPPSYTVEEKRHVRQPRVIEAQLPLEDDASTTA